MKINANFTELPEGYNYEIYNGIGGRRGVRLIKPDGTKLPLTGRDDDPISFRTAPEKVYAIGEIRNALVKEALNNEEEYYKHLHGCDKRTNEYLNACAKNIGFIDFSSSEELTINKDWKVISGGAINSSDIYCIKIEGGGYMIAYQVQADIDAVYESRYKFNHYPTNKEIEDAIKINDIRTAFALGKVETEFACWECGKEVEHWLDVEGNLETKYDRLKEKYCGC